MKFALQRLEPYPFKVRHELRKNMGNLPMRWKEIALAETIDELINTFILKHGEYRIINWETLETVYKP